MCLCLFVFHCCCRGLIVPCRAHGMAQAERQRLEAEQARLQQEAEAARRYEHSPHIHHQRHSSSSVVCFCFVCCVFVYRVDTWGCVLTAVLWRLKSRRL